MLMGVSIVQGGSGFQFFLPLHNTSTSALEMDVLFLLGAMRFLINTLFMML